MRINLRSISWFEKAIISVKRYTPVAAETFTRLKRQGKVALIPFITAGDPDLSTTAEALKVLDSCGSVIIVERSTTSLRIILAKAKNLISMSNICYERKSGIFENDYSLLRVKEDTLDYIKKTLI
ncbi:hypothetical protein Lal_00023116 [Lupinus albus]|nr:hypothetical protein Lal_00023116 [Lupinus albus]